MEGELKLYNFRGCISISSQRKLVKLLSHIIKWWKYDIKVEFLYENSFHHLTTVQPHCSSTYLFRYSEFGSHLPTTSIRSLSICSYYGRLSSSFYQHWCDGISSMVFVVAKLISSKMTFISSLPQQNRFFLCSASWAVARVLHRYTVSQQFGHHTCTHRHNTCDGYRYTPTCKLCSVTWNPQYHLYLWVCTHLPPL
jgi:hypothetical protein